MTENPTRVHLHETPRNGIYWQQRCIAAEAKKYSLETEVEHLKRSEEHYKDRSNYWMQKYILAEAKAHQALAEARTQSPPKCQPRN